jgi:hypothetical protein
MSDAFRTVSPNTIFESIRALAAADIEIGTVFFEIGIPTVFVVNRPQLVTPKLARIYTARVYAKSASALEEIWWHDSTWRTSDSLCELTDFNGTGSFPQGYIAELWENYGDPGQIHYELCGYRLVALSNDAIGHIYNKYVHRTEDSRPRLPPFIESLWHFSKKDDEEKAFPLVWEKAF